MQGQRIGYIRGNSFDRTIDRQLEYVSVDKVFIDKATDKDTQRPQLNSLLSFVRQGDTLVIHSMDRLARNLDDLRCLVQELIKRGVCIEFVKENLTFTGETPLLLSAMDAFAEFERALLLKWQPEEGAVAKKPGTYRGRKKALAPDQIANLRQRINAGEPKAPLARELGISRETLYQYLKSE